MLRTRYAHVKGRLNEPSRFEGRDAGFRVFELPNPSHRVHPKAPSLASTATWTPKTGSGAKLPLMNENAVHAHGFGL